MTDNLRDRIAQVLHRQYGPSLGAAEGGWDYEPTATQDVYRADADAVIAALGLREERLGDDIGHPHPQHRYVTAWTRDE